jgi:geranylgeranyl diphosphate synthase type I
MIYTGYRSLKNKTNKDVWNSCIAVELIHAFCLIHDDIMDNAKIRRGKPTVYKKLGLNKAILIGDVALILADELIPQKSRQYFDLLKWEVSAGQWLDIQKNGQWSQPKAGQTLPEMVNGQWLSKNEVFAIMDLKTARYTIARPLQIGASLAGADQKTLNALFRYGIKLGTAFQIQDDILGLFGDSKTIGKPVGQDIIEGKKTVLAAMLLKEIKKFRNLEIEGKILNIFGNQKATAKQSNWLKDIMIKYGILDQVKGQAKDLVNQANKELTDLKINKKQKQFLLEIGDYIISRRK